MPGLLRYSVVIALACLTRSAASQQAGPRNAADSLALTIAIYNVAFTNGTHTAHSADLPELVCVQGQKEGSDPPAAVIAALQENRTLIVRAMSGCRTEPLRSVRDGSLVVDTLTGKRGISVSAGEPKFTNDSTFTVNTGYYQHGLSSAGWLCDGLRSEGRWQIVKCRMLWIS